MRHYHKITVIATIITVGCGSTCALAQTGTAGMIDDRFKDRIASTISKEFVILRAKDADLEETLGDSVVDVITRGIGSDTAISKLKMDRILSLVRVAFSDPARILGSADKKPTRTLALLNKLSARSVDPSSVLDIAAAKVNLEALAGK